MGQPEKQEEGWLSHRVGWVATFIAAVALLAVIVIAATVNGLGIIPKTRSYRILEANIPLREQVYTGSILTSPTIVAIPQLAPGDTSLHSAHASPIVVVTSHQETARALRSGPGVEYAAVRNLVPDEQVQLLAIPIEINDQQWQLVRTGDDQVGWCMIHWLSSASAGE